MSGIAALPEPPYYAVVAPADLRPDVAGYPELAQTVMRAASEIDGFYGIETCYRPGFSIAVSYWSSLEAIDVWRNHTRHERAKDLGRSRWFDRYATRIAHVIDAY
ncbi:antibiotic biosynthesis monooxygenase family protein [Nocardia sp. NPDC049149]|uniref:antibiotic biosynthesis monooxygenase family protein n=1 Tax=Nocardia sp. NPDC049149 TaxID=3364315 RepID=UPI003714CF8B